MPTPIVENTILGTTGDDNLIGLNGADAISGRDGNDTISGGGGRDLLLGNDGDDSIDGGIGQDTLYGGRGNDYLLGGAGGDWLSGDDGVDTLRGGSGADVFYFNGKTAASGTDTILDFSLTAGDTLNFGKFAVGTSLIYVQNGNDVNVYVDLDGGLEPTMAQAAPAWDYLAVTVLNANAADVEAATSLII